MARADPNRTPTGRVAGLAVLFLALGATARAQVPVLSSLLLADEPTSSVNASELTTESLFPEADVPATSLGASADPAPGAPQAETELFDTITESLFGDVYAENKWRPLSLDTFFSEGWFESWAGAPAGRDGLAPRHGWLGAFDGVFYRLWLATFSYANNINVPFGGNRYTGTWSVFMPFSRRFEVLFDVPFAAANRTTDPPHGYTSQFGDLTVTPRFLLSESSATSQVFALAIRTPTGSTSTAGGIAALTPRYEFWTNPGGPWVVRGAAGVFIPLNQSETRVPTAYVGGLAVGRYFTPHDAAFGDLVFYCAANVTAPVQGSQPTVASVGPGTRFHIAGNWFFLADLDFPVTTSKPYNSLLQVALLKVF